MSKTRTHLTFLFVADGVTDILRWMSEELRIRDVVTGDINEHHVDLYRWLPFCVNDINYKLFIWWNDYGNSEDQHELMGYVERKVKLPGRILQLHKMVAPEATLCIHETLSASKRVSELRWYFERDVPSNDDEGVWGDHPNAT